jgi:two-component system OmpR family sensor kinase
VSLRVRLLLAVGAVALVALAIADIATYSSLRSFLYARVDQSLDGAHRALEGPGRGGGFSDARGIYVELRDVNNVTTYSQAARPFGPEEQVPKLPSKITGLTAHGDGNGGGGNGGGGADGGGSAELTRSFTSGDFRVRVSQLSDGGQLILALPLSDAQSTLHRLLVVELAVTLGALGAAAALGWSLVRVSLRPLDDVEATAAAIADGDLDRRVPGDDKPTEVGHLARALNTMLGRIQAAFNERDATEARLRQFVADASHELRTPVAAVSAYAELFDRGASSRPEDLKRVMTGIRTETSRMGDLVQDLLLLARIDEGRPLELQPVELVGLAAEAVDAAIAVGPAWPVQLEAAGPVEVVGDRARLRQVLDNLLGNIRAHTEPGTAAVVKVSAHDGQAEISVADQGPGLTEEQRARVFERFYRADASRSRQHGGSGLGLAIVAAIVGAHQGTVSITTPFSGGATFTVQLPQAATPEPSEPAEPTLSEYTPL